MPLFLGIYHKKGRLSLEAVQPMVDVFGGFAHRHLTRKEFPGFLFVSANEQEGENVFATSADGILSGLVGTLSIHGVASAMAAQSFLDHWIDKKYEGFTDLEGAFVGAVYDHRSHQLILVNDKFGMRPLFVGETEGYFAFCNELEPLLKLPGFRFAADHSAIATYFCLGTTLGGQTFVSGIRNLAPSTCLTVTDSLGGDSPQTSSANAPVSNGKVTQYRYWQGNIPIDHGATIEEHARRIVDCMRVVVPQMMDQLTNVRCLLSAGADSRLILSCMRPDQRLAVHWLTSNLSILPPEEDKDVIGANALATKLGLHHEVLQIAFSEMDFGPSYFDQVRNNRWKKIVGGWHGGEFLGGYCAHAAPIRRPPDRQAVDDQLRRLFSRRFLRHMAQHPLEVYSAAQAFATAENRDFHFQIQQFGRSFFTRIYHGSRGSWLQPYEIVNQGFSPFWDSRFLQILLQVPFEMVADYQLYNVIFRDYLRELVDVPSNSPLTLRPDSSLPRMVVGTEPKVALKPKFQNALEAFAADRGTWRRRMYRRWRFRRTLRDGDAVSTMQFIDFEAWWRRYGGG